MGCGILNLTAIRRGHFVYESGHHGDFWLDLELLCHQPNEVRRLATELAQRLKPYDIQAVCGPLVEGAFVALMVAEQLEVAYTYTERNVDQASDTLFPVHYQLPGRLRTSLNGLRVAIVNDVINAGSAVRGTHQDLVTCQATPVVIGSLLVLGDSAKTYCQEHKLGLEFLEARDNPLWKPEDCPLCREGKPLD